MIAECAIAPLPAISPCSAKLLSTLLPPIAAVNPHSPDDMGILSALATIMV
jgi:hypothetical protein